MIKLKFLFLFLFLFIIYYNYNFFTTNVNNYFNYCHHLEYIVYAFSKIKDNTIRFPFYLYNKKNKSLLEYYEKKHNIKVKKEYWILNDYYRNNDFSEPVSFNNFFNKGRERFIYVSRGNSKRRKIINEDYLISFLTKKIKNIEIVSFNEDTTFLEQAELFSNCKLFITLHGAALANLFYMSENSNIIELTAKDVYSHKFNEKAEKLKINHYYVDIENYEKSLEIYSYPRDSFLTIKKKEINLLEDLINKILKI